MKQNKHKHNWDIVWDKDEKILHFQLICINSVYLAWYYSLLMWTQYHDNRNWTWTVFPLEIDRLLNSNRYRYRLLKVGSNRYRYRLLKVGSNRYRCRLFRTKPNRYRCRLYERKCNRYRYRYRLIMVKSYRYRYLTDTDCYK